MKRMLQRWLGIDIHNESVDSSDVVRGTGLFDIFSGGTSSTGVAITEQNVMTVSAVYASVNLIAGAVASLPLPVYRRTAEARESIDHPYWFLLNRQPHPNISAAVFWEYLITSLLLQGDAFARIMRPAANSSKVIGFQPYHTSAVEVFEKEGALFYRLRGSDGQVKEVVDSSDMIHIPGPGFDGLTGKSQIRYALRNAAGVALAADDYSGGFFKNGARPDFALEFPGNLTDDQQSMIRNTWSDRFQGAANAHKPALLTGGAKVHELTINAEDAQLIETRKFQVEDIARIFGVPPHLIGHTEKSTSWGSGVEQMSIGFVKYTLQRHLVKIEQELNRKLFGTGRQPLFIEFVTAGLERGDYKTRNEGYRIALGRAGEPGWMSVDEVRRKENLPPLGGDYSQIQLGTTGGANDSTTETSDQ